MFGGESRSLTCSYRHVKLGQLYEANDQFSLAAMEFEKAVRVAQTCLGYNHQETRRWCVELKRVTDAEARQGEAIFNQAQIS